MRINKKIIVIAGIAIGVLAYGGYQANQNTVSTTSSTIPHKEYTNTTYDFSFSIPEDWRVIQQNETPEYSAYVVVSEADYVSLSKNEIFAINPLVAILDADTAAIEVTRNTSDWVKAVNEKEVHEYLAASISGPGGKQIPITITNLTSTNLASSTVYAYTWHITSDPTVQEHGYIVTKDGVLYEITSVNREHPVSPDIVDLVAQTLR